MLKNAFKNGDEYVFSIFYKRYSKAIARYVSARIADAHIVEDITQEIFIKAFRFRDSYDEKHEFSTWLWTIARNTVFDVLRKKKRADETLLIDDECSPEEIPDAYCDAESLLERKDTRRLFVMMMKPLTKLQRRVIWMRVVQQRSYDEISKQMGLSLSAAKNLVYRARLSMIESMENFPATVMG
jgi:RNA polymerase sigma-70 factor (ECF subfamily)